MAVDLELVSSREFRERLTAATGRELPDRLVSALYEHFECLRRWARRAALVGASEGSRLIERHYAESLRAAELVSPAERIVDLGSGAGFPGWVLAAALPELRFWLIESRQRKAAFLRSAAARAGLSCQIVNARVSRRQPLESLLELESFERIELITIRAVRWTEDISKGISSCLAEGGRILRWEGREEVVPVPGASRGRAVPLGSASRIQEWIRDPQRRH